MDARLVLDMGVMSYDFIAYRRYRGVVVLHPSLLWEFMGRIENRLSDLDRKVPIDTFI